MKSAQVQATAAPSRVSARRGRRIWIQMVKRYDLYLMLLVPIAWYLIFHYGPLYGLQIAFKNFNPAKGIIGSGWVGFDHFERFFDSYYFGRLLWNTLSINLFSLLIAFPISIVLALIVNEIRSKSFSKLLQNITFIPHFISVVVIVGILNVFLSPTTGPINSLIEAFGGSPIRFLEEAGWFKTIFIGSNIWQNMGWQSIIYIAALSGINPQLYEAAKMDGASRLRRVWHISLPGIVPVIVIMLILDIGHFMDIGFEKILLMQNNLNLEASDVISTFVYTTGILKGEYSYTAAIGLFNSVINLVLLLLVNRFARKTSETSLW
ncbi:sugar ABC transporter permease [Paenibacillus sp. SSG-1]|uniref:Aldouronate transport system permease protein n=1 Tax=Paenibacillus favisporus TaxID=221028 RepID=A0ABV2FDK5_9BACL|nr:MULTISPECIES: ABC transporter permease subunit [Paenibacillus]MCM2998326.1 ABC transporter permease subunit [Paenibacillus cellulositrophicus]OXL83717.1 sugar ABC transporter permease [Paenibacillus sp. SSG-1]RED40473.1 putative aldouronate transport system permease protein [Paenibacillus sp. VMFN-D1]UYO02755.1 ABC transporter permease subunit [Paenibacillus sp. PSB04]